MPATTAPVAPKARTRAAAQPAPPAPQAAPEPPAEGDHVDAPGWPRPGELFADPGATTAAPDPDPPAATDDGFRPYRPVYERRARRLQDDADAHDEAPHWLERAAAWRDVAEDDDRDPDALATAGEPDGPAEDAQPQPRRIGKRTRGVNGDARGAREREIATKLREALGGEELSPHARRLVASALAEFATGEADRVAAEAPDGPGR